MENFIPIVVRPTVMEDTTLLSASGSFTSVDKMRPTGDQPDKRYMESFKGWQKAVTSTLNGKARGCFTYRDKAQLTTHAIGTHLQLYAWRDGTVLDITPFTSYDNSKSNALSTTAGSREVQFNWGVHSFSVNDRLQFRRDVSIGGIVISAGTDVTVTSVATSTFSFSVATSAAATSANAGGDLKLGIYLSGGRQYSTAGPGWGDGAWGRGDWGGSDTATVYEARTHTFARWGAKNVQVNPSRQSLFEWDAIFTTPAELLVSTWTVGSGWAGSGPSELTMTSAVSASNASVSIGLVTGAFHRLDFDVSLAAGSGITALVGSTTIAASIAATGSYTYEFYAVSGDLTFTKNAAVVGVIDNISVKQMERLAQVPNAPSEINVMCVTAENITMAGGATDPITGEYSPLLLRWSDQFGNTEISVPANQVWTASATTQAGAKLLNKGTRIVALLPMRNETLIWTDTALYRAVYISDPRIVYRVTEVSDGAGILSSRAFAVLDGVVYWMAPQGKIFMYSGGQPTEMPFTLKDFVFDNMIFVQQTLVHASPFARKGEVQFFYPRRDSGKGSEISHYAGVTKSGESFGGTMQRTCRMDAGITQYPWAVDQVGQIYWHEIGNAGDNAPIGETFSTGMIGIGNGETLAQIDRFRPDFKNMLGTFELTIKAYMSANDQNPTTFGPYSVTPTTSVVDLIDSVTGMLPTARYLTFHGAAQTYPSYVRFGTVFASIEDTGMYE